MEVWEKTRREAQPSQLYNETFIFRAERKRARQCRYAAVLEVYHVLYHHFFEDPKPLNPIIAAMSSLSSL